MPNCKACGAYILWIDTISGKKMPVNSAIINIVPDTKGDTLAVTLEGIVVRGRQVGDAHEGKYELARISHFATCVKADKFRKRKAPEI